MKIFKSYTLKFAAILMAVALLSCEDDEDKLTGKFDEGKTEDLSSRITGFDVTKTGGGARLTVMGSDLGGVVRALIAGIITLDIEVTESAVTFTVPATTPLGEQEVLLIFSGAGRASSVIEVVPLPVISHISTQSGDQGDEIQVYGNNFQFVTAATVGTVAASVSNVTNTSLTVTIPSGAQTGSIGVISEAGTDESSETFYACEAEPDNLFCQPYSNTDGGFEAGTIGALAADYGNWFFAGKGTRANYELVTRNGADLGEKTLMVTMVNPSANNWEAQAVETTTGLPAGRRWILMGRINADVTGRLARVTGGVSVPGYQDMIGGTNLTLSAGWNQFAVEIQHDRSRMQEETQIRAQINLSYTENVGAVFLLDDIRIIDVGEWVDCTTDAALYEQLYSLTTCP